MALTVRKQDRNGEEGGRSPGERTVSRYEMILDKEVHGDKGKTIQYQHDNTREGLISNLSSENQ